MRFDQYDWTSYGTDGFLVRRTAKGKLYPECADSVFLILMGDWCGKDADNHM
jgi:hypothetical protein